MIEPLSLFIGGASGVLATVLVKRNREDRPTPATLADELNWAFLVDDGVILQKDGALLAGFRYRGPDLGGATAAELEALGAQLNDALLPYTDGWMFHVDAIRSPAEPYGESAFPSQVTAWIDAERRSAFRSSRPQFVSEYTICVTYLPPKELYSRAAAVFVRGSGRTFDIASLIRGYRDAIELLRERLASRLRVERLDSDGLVSHLHRCLTTLPHPVTAPPHGAYLNTVLASQDVIGGFAPKVGEQHVRIVAITAYPGRSGVGKLDFLNALPFPYRWSSRFIPMGQQLASRLIKRQQRKWFMGRKGMGTFIREAASKGEKSEWRERQEEELFNDRDATDMARDAAEALAENSAGSVRFGFATQVILVSAEDTELAHVRARALLTTLQDHGFTARLETVNAMDAFFGSLPGHGTPNLRRPMLNTGNVAALWPVTSVWPGLASNPSQYFPRSNPPLAHVATDGSTPFRLNLHVGDVGHTLLVGATGAGKSTLVGFLIAQWQRYTPAKTFVFDVGYSHWLLGKAAGAQHYDIGGSATGAIDAVALQPLADVDRPDERAWAAEWIELLLELQGVPMTPARRLRIDRALLLVAEQPREFRTLTELMVQLQDAALVDALRPYTVGGPFGRLLDGQQDAVGEGSYQIFELKHLLDMGDKILVPVLLHLFRCVERQLDGSPALIVIEELWAALMRTVFTSRIRQWLLTLRKQNAAVLLVAHSLAQLDQVAAKQVLIESCPTKILLPNADASNSANARLYQDLGLNEREIAIIAEAVPKRDYYVKSPLGSRLVTLGLGPVALAFLATPEGATIDGIRPIVEQLVAREAERWPAEWLGRLGITIPDEFAANAREHGAARVGMARSNGRAAELTTDAEERSYADSSI